MVGCALVIQADLLFEPLADKIMPHTMSVYIGMFHSKGTQTLPLLFKLISVIILILIITLRFNICTLLETVKFSFDKKCLGDHCKNKVLTYSSIMSTFCDCINFICFCDIIVLYKWNISSCLSFELRISIRC